MKKFLAIVLSVVLVVALAATSFAGEGEATWADYQQYLIDTAGSNAPDLQEFTDQVMAINSWEELDQTVSPWDQMFTTIGLSTWEEFAAGEVKGALVPEGENMGGGDAAAEGESEGESAEGESAEEAAPAEEGESAAEEGESGDSAAFEAPEYEDLGIAYTSYENAEGYTVYDVTMTMQAGYQEYQAYPGGGVMTIHAGVGFMDPFGEGYYYAGIMYPESLETPEAIYVSDWMDANYGCSLFCIYHTNAGDIYAWDGIYGANARDLSNYMTEGTEPYYTVEEVNGSVPTRTDALINIVCGGTGIFKGAYGILIGSTSGGGYYDTRDGMTLPQALFKFMDGYIVVPDDCETLSLYEVTQELSEDTSVYEVIGSNYVMVPLTLRAQGGGLEQDVQQGAIGTLLPFNSNALNITYGGEAEAQYNVSDYVNDNFLAAYGEPEFVTLKIDNEDVKGDIYGYIFKYGCILDETSALSEGGSQEATFILLVDGTEDFAGATAMLVGYTVQSDYEGWGDEYQNDTPNVNMTRAEGWMKLSADSAAAAYGNDVME